MKDSVIRLATRTSPLALHQANRVADRLRALGVSVDLVGIESSGDLDKSAPIRSFAEHGAFTTAIDRAVLDGRADVAVHSAKDLPSSETDEKMVIAAVPEREDPRDVLVGRSLADLSPGGVVATGSVRRRVQLAFVRPDLGFVELRGNIAARLSKVPPGGAVLVANAALIRLSLDVPHGEVLALSVMLSQVGQGAIALRCQATDDVMLERLSAIDDLSAHRAVRAERAFLRHVGGGCDAPVAAHAVGEGETGEIEIDAMIASDDGHVITRRRHRGADPERVGQEVAQLLVARSGAGLLENQANGR